MQPRKFMQMNTVMSLTRRIILVRASPHKWRDKGIFRVCSAIGALTRRITIRADEEFC
jgi:hypothetical protein